MIPRKRRKIMIILSVVMAVVLIIIGLIAIYLTTDMFKGNDVLFAKYLTQYSSIIKEVKTQNTMDEVEQLLENNKYISVLEGTVEYSEDASINDAKLIIEGKTDRKSRIRI